MLEQLRALALQALAEEPALKREIVQLVGAIEAHTGTPRTFPSRALRRADRVSYERACEALTDRVQ